MGYEGFMYYELLKSNQTVTAKRYQQQSFNLNRALNQKCLIIAQRKTQNNFVA